MADYHFVYKDVEGASTQWDDIQRKLGNLPTKEPPFKPPAFAPANDEDSEPKDKTGIDGKIVDELEDLEDDLDDDRFLENYRKMRLAEIKEVAKVQRFGSVLPISGSDFVMEVSQAPSDVWVVVILYKDGYPKCGLLMQCLEELATKYPATKFVKIISTDCIPNYPDRNLPTLLVYNNGAVKANHVGLHSFGRRCTPEDRGAANINQGSNQRKISKHSRKTNSPYDDSGRNQYKEGESEHKSSIPPSQEAQKSNSGDLYKDGGINDHACVQNDGREGGAIHSRSGDDELEVEGGIQTEADGNC